MKELRGVDLKRAQLVPSSVFANPDQVVTTDRLSLPQKLAILRRWEFDARRVQGFGQPLMLRRIRGALQALNPRRPERPMENVAPYRPGTAHPSDATPHEAIFRARHQLKP